MSGHSQSRRLSRTSGSLSNASSSRSRKSRRSSSSDSPSSSATNSNGRKVLDERLRSVLSHPLGLPLTQALHGKDPASLRYLEQETHTVLNEEQLERIFEEAVNEWVKNDAGDRPIKEQVLTKKIAKKIEETLENICCSYKDGVNYQSNFTCHIKQARIDILLSPPAPNETTTRPPKTTPLALIEVGRNNLDWWKKFDQNTKYIEAMLSTKQPDPQLQFDDPLLSAVLTIAGEDKDQPFVKFGVFLCAPKRNGSLRMTLLWHVSASNLNEASKAFGRFLLVTSWFANWRGRVHSSNRVHSSDEYQYLSSNCCRVGKTHVLRSYDSRFRKTDRSPEIYTSPSCKSIVGEVEVVMELSDATASTWVTAKDDKDPFWTNANSSERKLQVIAVPYKPGKHCAEKPTDFVPIVQQLQQLHSNGFVHGDIRAFNVVFGEEGGLIDFDLGGKPGRPYPPGYRDDLRDGRRIRSGEIGDEDNKLAFWHDWFALGQLMFYVHRLKHDKESVQASNAVRKMEMEMKWTEVSSDPTPDDIEQLILFLQDLDRQGWTVRPSIPFQDELEKIKRDAGSEGTLRGATGSPPQKK